jgi:hypothetical protein
MTAAMIRTAAFILDNEGIEDNEIVTFIELGSEGAILRIGQNVPSGDPRARWNIARDGSYTKEERG